MENFNVQMTSTVQVPETVAFEILDGESVLLNFVTGKYYGLDQVGTRMFNLMKELGGLEAVFQALLKEYDVEEDRLRTDLLKLANDLAERGLITVH